jgi:sphingolipid C9-methyltransferase
MSSSETKSSAATSGGGVGVRTTNYPTIHNSTLPAEGNGSFSNLHLAALVLGIPFVVKRLLPLVNRGGFYTYVFLVLVLGVPITVSYWTLMSIYGPRKNEKCILPGRPLEHYITINDPELKKKYSGDSGIPMQIFHDAYFDGLIDFNGEHLVSKILARFS